MNIDFRIRRDLMHQSRLVAALSILCMFAFVVMLVNVLPLTADRRHFSAVDGTKENTVMFAYRQQLEEMLIRDEVGSTTVNHMLTVTHDGQTALVVGIGHDVVPADALRLGDKITLQQAVSFFEHDVDSAITIARNLVDGFDSHPPETQVVLCALAFQLGATGLKGFHNMLEALRRKDYAAAAGHLLDSKLAREQSVERAHREAALIGEGEK